MATTDSKLASVLARPGASAGSLDRMNVAVRALTRSDEAAVLELADRLCIGVAPWREGRDVALAVRGWVADSIRSSNESGHAVFVAADTHAGNVVAGFVSVSERTHFTGQIDAYIGELVVDEPYERRGVGRQLIAEAEQWARRRDLRQITLETGAQNATALAFYEHLGYAQEDIRLSRSLDFRDHSDAWITDP